MDITDFTAELLAFGEPTHFEPAFARIRNDLFARLAGHGFRAIALETDRVAALDGEFSHGFGELEANRQLLAWLREYNEAAAEPLTFHGFDAPTEMFSAPSPRTYLEHAGDYLGLDVDIAALTGDDERWSRPEAILDPAESPGASPEARELRVIADDLLMTLDARVEPAAHVARIHAIAGLDLLRYHAASARPGDRDTRIARLAGVRAVIMARNLLDIHASQPGRTLVFAHNAHLGSGAGAIVASRLGDRYAFIAGSLGHSEALGLGEPAADTCEGHLQRDTDGWQLTAEIPAGHTREDADYRYAPLTRELLDSADAVLHIA
ncbi:Protein-L-isoaspartate O-methyltransferase (EC [Amycolatopsis camponoti]|uniref:Protein-L-isoaspartate O-methyltransferase (EC) n=1 Tax=Amycolatopsis camponoti TaxID=2606593 RepID=A0A6I8M0Y9_9PSEU|nr:erythromycin esterase family protein [Amycolatopsis camponoti]VVJ22587.1 Protein-L-isoaspartate O-methyltransferase (EC [Amycolatopsis camponoti]